MPDSASDGLPLFHITKWFWTFWQFLKRSPVQHGRKELLFKKGGGQSSLKISGSLYEHHSSLDPGQGPLFVWSWAWAKNPDLVLPRVFVILLVALHTAFLYYMKHRDIILISLSHKVIYIWSSSLGLWQQNPRMLYFPAKKGYNVSVLQEMNEYWDNGKGRGWSEVSAARFK